MDDADERNKDIKRRFQLAQYQMLCNILTSIGVCYLTAYYILFSIVPVYQVAFGDEVALSIMKAQDRIYSGGWIMLILSFVLIFVWPYIHTRATANRP